MYKYNICTYIYYCTYILLFLCRVSFFFYIFALIYSYGLAFCTVTLLQFNFFSKLISLYISWHFFFYFVLLLIRGLVHACIIIYVLLCFVFLIMCNIDFLFSFLFVCLHLEHDISNHSFYLYMFLYVYTLAYVVKCWFYCHIFLLYLQFNISITSVNIM